MEEDDGGKHVHLAVPEDVPAVVPSLVPLGETPATHAHEDLVVLGALLRHQRRQRAKQVELGEARDLAHLREYNNNNNNNYNNNNNLIINNICFCKAPYIRKNFRSEAHKIHCNTYLKYS